MFICLAMCSPLKGGNRLWAFIFVLPVSGLHIYIYTQSNLKMKQHHNSRVSTSESSLFLTFFLSLSLSSQGLQARIRQEKRTS